LKTYIGFALLFLLLSLGTVTAHGETQSHNGYWWADSAENFKLGFATGYAIAMTDASDAAAFRCLAAKNGGKVPEKYPGDEVFTACSQSPEAMSHNFGNIRVGQLVEGVDEFYKDFRNKNIEIQLAMQYVRDELKGKPAKELEDGLTGWRQRANNPH
jgi:hypothetical protein